MPEHPVISPVSGSIFERRLIEKYLNENGVDPVNGQELTVEQLIDIKGILGIGVIILISIVFVILFISYAESFFINY